MAYNDLFNWMQPQADDYAHGQIDSEIDNNTLMDMVVGPQLLDIPSVDLAYQERTPEIRQTRLEDYSGVSQEDLLSMVMGTMGGGGGRTLKSILSSIRTGGKNLIRGQSSQVAKPGLSRAERTIEKTVAKAKGVPLAGKRGDMMEKAQRFLIPSARADKVYVPGHAYYTSGKFRGGFAKHLEFAPKTFKSEKTLNTAIKNIQSRISESKNKIRQFTAEGEKAMVGPRVEDLYIHQQKLEALVDFKRAPEKELVEKLHKFMESRPSGDVSWYSMGQRIYEDSFGYTYSKGFTKMPSSWK